MTYTGRARYEYLDDQIMTVVPQLSPAARYQLSLLIEEQVEAAKLHVVQREANKLKKMAKRIGLLEARYGAASKADRPKMTRVVAGAVKRCVTDHGPIDRAWSGSAAQRIVTDLMQAGLLRKVDA